MIFIFVFFSFLKGIEYTDKDLITVRVKALNPGKARIQAIAVLPGGQRFTSTVDVSGKYFCVFFDLTGRLDSMTLEKTQKYVLFAISGDS